MRTIISSQYIHYLGVANTKMFLHIDAYSLNKKSSQAKRQNKTCQVGSPSTRSPPTGAPDWAIILYSKTVIKSTYIKNDYVSIILFA